MAQTSLFWSGTVTGDAGPYTNDQFTDWQRKLFQSDRSQIAVLEDYASELAVTVTANATPAHINSGAAIVDGNWYENTANVDLAIPTPSTSTREDAVVLEKDFAAQTVRLTLVQGVEGSGPAALTQTDGVTWQVPLATLSTTTGGFVTVTDTRLYISTVQNAVDVGTIYYTVNGVAPKRHSEYTAGRGLYIVGLPSGGTNLGTVGTLLSNMQNRDVALHTHTINDPGHVHDVNAGTGSGGAAYINTPAVYSASFTVSNLVVSNTTGITAANTGTVAGTNAPYIQMLMIKKD